jgi:DNA-binding ferritin-like protein
MQRHIFSRFFMSEAIEKKSLSEIAQDVAVFFFNMRTCHFKTSGKEFLELHEYAQELYEQAEEYYDDLIETAISYDEEVVPMCIVPDDWMPDYSVYDKSVQGTIDMMKDCVKILFDRLESLKDGYSSFVYSKRDTILEWLDKQNYKLEQMSAVI